MKNRHVRIHLFYRVLLLAIVSLTSSHAEELISEPRNNSPISISIASLQRLGLEANGLIRAAESRVDVAKAGVVSAGAYPNPELEFVGGHNRARAPGPISGNSYGHMSANELKIHFYVLLVLVQLKLVFKLARQVWIGRGQTWLLRYVYEHMNFCYGKK